VACPLRIQYSGAFYHVTSRGNERKTIFRNDRDREKFLSYLQSAFDVKGSAVSQASRRFKQTIMEEPSLRDLLRQIVRKLKLLNVET
jgi:hypothetical protein